MSATATTQRPPTPLSARAIIRLAAGLSGGLYGLALARFLFESDPRRFTLFGDWPGALGLALAAGAALLIWRRAAGQRVPPSAALALVLPAVSVFSPDVDLLRSQTLLAGSLMLFGLLHFDGQPRPASRLAWLRPGGRFFYPAFLFCLLAALYLRTLAPAVGEADTFEFQVGIARLGVAHGSGYPLLMLLGKVFTLLPLGGTLAFRANLTSAFFAALAGVGVERLARRMGAGTLVGFLAGFAFGVSPTLWSRAVEVEAYTLNAALVAGLLHLCLALVEHPRLQPPTFNVLLLAFLFGLSLTNHLTTLVLAPACLISVGLAFFTGYPPGSSLPVRRALRDLALAALLLLLGLSVYLYLPLRWPAVNNGEWLSLEQFANILSGGEAKGAFDARLAFTQAGRYAIVGRKILGEYGWIGAALALVGTAGLVFRQPALEADTPETPPARRQSRWAIPAVLALAYAGYGFFALSFNVPDPDFSAFLIPMHLLAAVLMGLGVHAIGGALRRGASSTASPGSRDLASAARVLLLAAFALLPLRSIWLTMPAVDRSRNWDSYQLGQFILRYPLAQGATVLADSLKIAPLFYLQIAEGARPDLDIVVLPDEDSYRAVLDERIAAGTTVYLGRYLPGLGSGYSLRSVGPLAEVSPVPFTSPAESAQRLSMAFTSGVQLIGYDIGAPSSAGSRWLPVTLYWHTDEAVDENVLVNLRLADQSGRIVWQSAGSVPVGGLYPTNAWRPGETVSDFHAVPLAPTMAPGEYQLEVGLFPPFQAPADTGWAAVMSVAIPPAAEAPRPARALRAQFGDVWLMGYAAPEAAAPGSRLAVTLYWQPSPDLDPVTAFGETHSLAAWPAGRIVPQSYALTAPETDGRFDLTVDAGVPARCGWLAPQTANCPLPPVRLAGEAIADGSVNFDNQLVLMRAALVTPAAAPGGWAEVTLYWQGLRSIGEDYTVFVHLLGPDGLVHGQVDAWPVSGTLATSRWKPGQAVEDHYRVWVPEDAPPGAYHVEIGMYLLATLERLPVLNADGAPVDDRVLLPGLVIR